MKNSLDFKFTNYKPLLKIPIRIQIRAANPGVLTVCKAHYTNIDTASKNLQVVKGHLEQ